MSEAHASNDEKPAVEGSTPPAPGNPARQSDPVKRWTYIVLAVCLVLLVWYLRSDRLTPTTSQARVHALVVPIAPEISGTVTGVKVGNSQVVSVGQELFQLDIERYEYDLQNAQAALDQAYQGQGHSCGIYSYNDDNIMKLAAETRTSRVMVNQPQAASNSGNLWNGMRQTFSLGCGSWGGNSINHNITWRDLVNETWVSKPLAETKVIPSDEELFGSVMAKFS